jgi:hypothetical protein
LTFRSCIPFLLLFVSLVVGCAQRQSNVGARAITGQPSDSFIVVNGTAAAGANWKPHFTNGRTRLTEIGAARGISAYTAVRVDARTGLPDSVRVDSMNLKYRKVRIWSEPDIAAVLFRVREIPGTVIWKDDSLVDGVLADHDSYPPLDSQLVSVADSVADSVLVYEFRQPQATWNKWRSDTTGGGILFEAATPGAIFEYITREQDTLAPAVYVHGSAYLPSDSAWHDTTLKAVIGSDGYLVVDTAARSPERLFVSEGFPERMAIFFRLDTLLGDTSIQSFSRSVNRAEMTLYRDTASHDLIEDRYQNILLKQGQIRDTSWVRDSARLYADGMLGQELTITSTVDSTNTRYVLDVTSLVNFWVTNPDSNGGIQIRSADELGGYIAREVFYSPLSEDPTKKPKLTIWFTETSY